MFLQPIQLESAPGQVETAILHLVETDCASPSLRRGSAMHDHNPLHSFLFDSQGQLLFANKAASKACQISTPESGAPLGPRPYLKRLTLQTQYDICCVRLDVEMISVCAES